MEALRVRRLVYASFGRLLDVSGAMAEIPRDGEEAALEEDWQRTGDDFRYAIRIVSGELTDEQRAGLEEKEEEEEDVVVPST